MLFRRENISVLNVVMYRIVQSWALMTANKLCIQPACMKGDAMKS